MQERVHVIDDGLRKASALALNLGLNKEALTISLRARHERPGIWSFRDSFNSGEIFQFIFRIAIVAAAKGNKIHEKDLLPRELVPVCSSISKSLKGKDFIIKAKSKLSKLPLEPHNAKKGKTHPSAMSYDERQSAERFLTHRLLPLLDLTNALALVLPASKRNIDKYFIKVVEAWEKAREVNDSYRLDGVDPCFQFLGFSTTLFIFRIRTELKKASVQRFLSTVHNPITGPENLIQIVAILAKRNHLRELAGEQAIKAHTLIQTEDEVSYRAALYSDLAHAVLPANVHEASHYFREGLDQMDVIGSGDYEFTNELLLFASAVQGDELDERDFHTLSNIAELNMGEESHKFYWGAYGRGMARVSGLRGLAKLSRWEDRDRISLSSTLLPYLIGLLEHGKIQPRDALALNRLANPAEYYNCGTKEFAEEIGKQEGKDPDVITMLIEQFRDDNPDVWMASFTEKLASLAGQALGPSSNLAQYLKRAIPIHAQIIDTRNVQRNYSGRSSIHQFDWGHDTKSSLNKEIDIIIKNTDPADESSITEAITKLNQFENTYSIKDQFFKALRAKINYTQRINYIKNISKLEHFFCYWKLAELKQAKEAWSRSSAVLKSEFKKLAIPLIRLHADDLIRDDRVAVSNIKEISELTGVSESELVLELIKVHAQAGSNISGTAWLTLASFICPRAKNGQGQLALSHLLQSEAAGLANKVQDGEWKPGLYPGSDFTEIAAGLIWRALGSPEAVRRWRAAHSMRDFAAWGNWQVIDSLVNKWNLTTAGPFQAPELVFYYMHARLWLLIALARLTIDYPDRIVKYKDLFLAILTNSSDFHILMRHFAAQALFQCNKAGKLTLSAKLLRLISGTNKSPYRPLKVNMYRRRDFYHGRPDGTPKPSFEFSLDYDFHKSDVDRLARVFGKSCWEAADMMSSIVHGIDSQATGMHDSGGRESRRIRTHHGISTHYHDYGQYLGWHALLLTAGNFLALYPVFNNDWSEDPWGEWLEEYLLTRKDGLWLSDGMDRTPLDAHSILLEQKKKGLTVTGDKNKILNLAGLDTSGVNKQIIIDGRWHSADKIRVRISTALVTPPKAVRLARKVLREEPMLAWLPTFHNNENDLEYLNSDKKEYTPWIVCPSSSSHLDLDDPYGAYVANNRSRLAQVYTQQYKLTTDDPFGRIWHNSQGTEVLRAEAWGRNDEDREEGIHPGQRLFCRSTVLKKILNQQNMNLLVLFNLERCERSYRHESTYTHSVGAAVITKSLEVKYFKGPVNHLFKSRL